MILEIPYVLNCLSITILYNANLSIIFGNAALTIRKVNAKRGCVRTSFRHILLLL